MGASYHGPLAVARLPSGPGPAVDSLEVAGMDLPNAILEVDVEAPAAVCPVTVRRRADDEPDVTHAGDAPFDLDKVTGFPGSDLRRFH